MLLSRYLAVTAFIHNLRKILLGILGQRNNSAEWFSSDGENLSIYQLILAWYPLFAHALNFPEILENQETIVISVQL